jgi:outer membrane protein TolC
MKYLRNTLIVIAVFWIPVMGYAQENEILKLSVAEAQEYALLNNHAILSSRVDIKIADKRVLENLAAGLPQITVNANYLHQFVVPQLSFGSFLDVNALPDGIITKNDILNAYRESEPVPLGVRNNTTIDMTLSQLIFSGQYIVALQATKVLRQVSEKAVVKTEDLTKESVTGTYYLILVLQENIKLLTESMKTIEQTYQELSKMFGQGMTEDTDVDQISINKSNLQTLITSLESQKETTYKLLKFQLGVDFANPVVLTDSLGGVISSAGLNYLATTFQIQNSIDFQMFETQEKVSEQMLRLEKSKYLPTVAAFYRHQEQTNQPDFNFAVKDVVGATLTLPILASGMRMARVSQAKFNLEKMRLDKLNTEQGLIMEYETARNSYQTAFSTFNANKESMMLSKKVYEKTIIKFREGVSSSLELTQLQNQYLTAESNYYYSLLSLLNSKAKLDRILRVN